jgi:LexA DNA binding domain
MTAPLSDDAGRVYQYLAEYISAKNYPPTITQIVVALRTSRARVTSALKVLDQAGKIRFLPGRGQSRAAIRLAALPTQYVSNRVVTETASIKSASPKPGQIICMQCRDPVCEKSKWYCDLHLRLNREATKRSLDKKRNAGICLRCDVPAGPVSHVLCESHRKKQLEAKRSSD